jgi:glycine hydroxymethyltransferase
MPAELRAEGRPAAGRTTLLAPWAPGPARRRLREVQAAAPLIGSDAEAALVAAALAAEHGRRARGISLYAGANRPLGAEDDAAAQLGMRPSMGLPGAKHQRGLEHLEVVEILTARAVAATVGATWVDVRPQSATLANLAVYAALTAPGATLAALPERAGAHASHRHDGTPAIRGHRVVDLPYDAEGHDVDLDALPAFLHAQRPALVILGASLTLFPHRLGAIADAVHDAGGLVLYDASHTAGLIAGGAFQDPLAEGADVVTFSTYKSYGGPPGGAIATRSDSVARRIDAAVYPQLTSNYDAGRLPALYAAARLLLHDGGRYAAACVAAARALAAELDARDVPVAAPERGFTASHHVAVLADSVDAAAAALDRLAACGLDASAAAVPGTGETAVAAIRLGTQELVRAGLDAGDMAALAGLIAAALAADPSPAEIGRGVADLRAVAARRPTSSMIDIHPSQEQ